MLKPQHKQILKEFAHSEQRLPKMHKADNATSPGKSQRLFKSGLKLFSPDEPGIQTASVLLPSVPQGAGKLGRASPQPGVKAKRGGFKPAQAVLPPGQSRLKVMSLPCPVPGNSASCEVGLCRAPLHKQRSGTCCVVLTPDHFPISFGAGPGELLNQPQPAPLPKGPCGCCQHPARSWAQPRPHHPSPKPLHQNHLSEAQLVRISLWSLYHPPFVLSPAWFGAAFPPLCRIPWPHPPRQQQWLQLCIHSPRRHIPWQLGMGGFPARG